MIDKKTIIDDELLKTLGDIGDEWYEYKNSNFENFAIWANVALPLASLVYLNYAIPTDKGNEQMLETYNHLVDFANENNCKSMEDLLALDKEIPTYKMTIRIPN
jgi:hypothetical protein